MFDTKMLVGLREVARLTAIHLTHDPAVTFGAVARQALRFAREEGIAPAPPLDRAERLEYTPVLAEAVETDGAALVLAEMILDEWSMAPRNRDNLAAVAVVARQIAATTGKTYPIGV